jgi:phenol hydroxylase P3 protein
MRRRLSLKELYQASTYELEWEPTYVRKEDAFPYCEYEGIKVRDWSKWEDPFRMTHDAYVKLQAEKDKIFYSVLDSFAQTQSFLNLSDGRYVNALKLFFTGVTLLEYMAHRGHAFVSRAFPSSRIGFSAFCQSMDELRHTQTQLHTASLYNKYFHGLHSIRRMHDRVWYLSVPKSYFDDAVTGGPFEYMTAISFSFEYALTNLLFVPFMSGAGYNNDQPTVNFGFSAQSDEARHMTLGASFIRFVLEQHEDNLPIVQDWLEKWMWRGYRVTLLAGVLMDYFLPKKLMSWREALELYFEQQVVNGLLKDLELYGVKPLKSAEYALKEVNTAVHDVYWTLFSFTHAAAFHTWIPEESHLDWLCEKYPDAFPTYYRPRWEKVRQMKEKEGVRFYYPGLPQLCTVCQFPVLFVDPEDPRRFVFRYSVYRGEIYHFCSEFCKWIFDREPEKYIQSWLPVHEIYAGRCGGPTVPDVLSWYGFEGDNMDYFESEDYRNWSEWHKEAKVTA